MTESKVSCNACGAAAAPIGSRFCPSCGAQLTEAEIPVMANAVVQVEHVEQDASSDDDKSSTFAEPSTTTFATASVNSTSTSQASYDGANFFKNPTPEMLERGQSLAVGGVLFIESSVPKGKFTVPKSIKAGQILGDLHIDMSRADFVHPISYVAGGAILGGLKVTVPRGVRVETHGMGILGSFKGLRTQNQHVGNTDTSPLLVVRGGAILSSVKVVVNADVPPVRLVE